MHEEIFSMRITPHRLNFMCTYFWISVFALLACGVNSFSVRIDNYLENIATRN